ncbi:MAG: hypothetical protein ACE366_26285 [Bradymonadia bacterium]
MYIARHFLKPTSLVLALALVGFGCDDDDGDSSGTAGAGGGAAGSGGEHMHGGEGGHTGFDEVALACDHMEGGPFTDVTLGGDEAPDVTPPHTHYRLTLADNGDGTFGGMVHFHPQAASEYIFMLTAEVPIEITDAEGNVLSPEMSANTPEQCPAAAHVMELDFPAGMHMIRLGPAPSADVGLVIHQPGMSHDHGGHDHGDHGGEHGEHGGAGGEHDHGDHGGEQDHGDHGGAGGEHDHGDHDGHDHG